MGEDATPFIDLEDLRDEIALHLERLRVILPADYLLTLVGRNVAIADADVIVTQDTDEGIQAALAGLLPSAPPRPWHYVTEKLPEPRQGVRFWRYWPGSNQPVLSAAGKYICTKEGHSWFGAWPTPDRAALSPDGAVVFAWEPEPEPPPLPEPPPTADEVYGILSPAHPLNGGPVFNEDGKEAAGPPVDPDLLQAVKDAARMERKR